MAAYLWKKWDRFCLGINQKSKKVLAMAELENDEYKYNDVWFRAIMPEGNAWWHTQRQDFEAAIKQAPISIQIFRKELSTDSVGPLSKMAI